MRTGFVLLHLEADDRALELAVAAAAHGGVRLPVVRARVVEPEGGEVEERLLRLPGALALVGLEDRRLLTDDAVPVLAVGLADVHEDARAGSGDLHAEDRGLALR